MAYKSRFLCVSEDICEYIENVSLFGVCGRYFIKNRTLGE